MWEPSEETWLEAASKPFTSAPFDHAFVSVLDLPEDRDLPRAAQLPQLVDVLVAGGAGVAPVWLQKGLRGWVVIDGRHRIEAARQAGILEVPAFVVRELGAPARWEPVGNSILGGDEADLSWLVDLRRLDGFDGPIPPQFSKSCGCGKTYTEVEWELLPRREDYRAEPDPSDPDFPEGYLLENRDCSCGSTISVQRPLPTDLGAIASVTTVEGIAKMVREIQRAIEFSTEDNDVWVEEGALRGLLKDLAPEGRGAEGVWNSAGFNLRVLIDYRDHETGGVVSDTETERYRVDWDVVDQFTGALTVTNYSGHQVFGTTISLDALKALYFLSQQEKDFARMVLDAFAPDTNDSADESKRARLRDLLRRGGFEMDGVDDLPRDAVYLDGQPWAKYSRVEDLFAFLRGQLSAAAGMPGDQFGADHQVDLVGEAILANADREDHAGMHSWVRWTSAGKLLYTSGGPFADFNTERLAFKDRTKDPVRPSDRAYRGGYITVEIAPELVDWLRAVYRNLPTGKWAIDTPGKILEEAYDETVLLPGDPERDVARARIAQALAREGLDGVALGARALGLGDDERSSTPAAPPPEALETDGLDDLAAAPRKENQPVEIRRIASFLALERIAADHRSLVWAALRENPTALYRIFNPRRGGGGWLYNVKKEDQIREFVEKAGLTNAYQSARARFLEIVDQGNLRSIEQRERFFSLDAPPILPIYVDYDAEQAFWTEDDLVARVQCNSRFGWVVCLFIQVDDAEATRRRMATDTSPSGTGWGFNIQIDSHGHTSESFYGVGRHRAEASASYAVVTGPKGRELFDATVRILAGYGIPELAISAREGFAGEPDAGIPTLDELALALDRFGVDKKRIGTDQGWIVSTPAMREGSEREGLWGLGDLGARALGPGDDDRPPAPTEPPPEAIDEVIAVLETATNLDEARQTVSKWRQRLEFERRWGDDEKVATVTTAARRAGIELLRAQQANDKAVKALETRTGLPAAEAVALAVAKHPELSPPREVPKLPSSEDLGAVEIDLRKSDPSYLDVEQLAKLFGLPLWEDFSADFTYDDAWVVARQEVERDISEDDFETTEAYDEAVQAKTEELALEYERQQADEEYSKYRHAFVGTIERFLEHVDLALTEPNYESPDRRDHFYRVTPKGGDWVKAANEILGIINGVGYFEFHSLAEFLASGPYSARSAVLAHLGSVTDYAAVYGEPSARATFERHFR